MEKTESLYVVHFNFGFGVEHLLPSRQERRNSSGQILYLITDHELSPTSNPQPGNFNAKTD
jgi:hypothetical protein